MKFTGEYFVPGATSARSAADHLARYDFASRFVRGKSVLDIACGVGYASEMLLAAGAASYTGVDINPDLVEHALATYSRPAARFLRGDICNFYEGKPYDVITCFETIEHVSDYLGALQNLHGLLADRGVLLISSPNRRVTSPSSRLLSDKPENPYHTQEFIPVELIGFAREAGFQVQSDHLYGQRLRLLPPFRIPLLNSLLRRLSFNPDTDKSPEVLPLGGKQARYFVLRCSKGAGTASVEALH